MEGLFENIVHLFYISILLIQTLLSLHIIHQKHLFERTLANHYVRTIFRDHHVETIVTKCKGRKHTLTVIMDAELFEKRLENTLFLTEDMKDHLHSDEKEDITGALDRLTGLPQRIDAAREKTMDLLS